MLNSKNFTNLVDFPNSSSISKCNYKRWGELFFLWDKNYEGKCEIKTIENKKISGTSKDFLVNTEMFLLGFLRESVLLIKLKFRNQNI